MLILPEAATNLPQGEILARYVEPCKVSMVLRICPLRSQMTRSLTLLQVAMKRPLQAISMAMASSKWCLGNSEAFMADAAVPSAFFVTLYTSMRLATDLWIIKAFPSGDHRIKVAWSYSIFTRNDLRSFDDKSFVHQINTVRSEKNTQPLRQINYF